MSQVRQPEHPIHPLFTDRWSPRAFSGEVISEPELLTLLEAARWAPSAYNIQPWRFVYARRETPSWQPIFDTLVEFNQLWTHRASALVVIASATEAMFSGKSEASPNPWRSFDSGAAWASIAFQATLSGWSAHGMAGFDTHKLGVAVGLPDDHAIETVIAIGKRGDKAVLPDTLQGRESPNGRRPLSELVSEGRFSAGA